MNKTIIIGRLTKDVDLKSIGANNTAVVNNTIATSRYKQAQNGEKIEETLFLDVVAFNRTAEIMSQYLKKGSKIAVEGHLQQQTWVDNQSGQNRNKIVLVIESMQMLDSKEQDNTTQKQNTYANYKSNNYTNGGDSDIPF